MFCSITSYHSACTITCGEGNVQAEYTRFVTIVEPWAAKLCNEEDGVTALYNISFSGHDLKLMEVNIAAVDVDLQGCQTLFSFSQDRPQSSSMLPATMGYHMNEYERTLYRISGSFRCPLNMVAPWVGSRVCCCGKVFIAAIHRCSQIVAHSVILLESFIIGLRTFVTHPLPHTGFVVSVQSGRCIHTYAERSWPSIRSFC